MKSFLTIGASAAADIRFDGEESRTWVDTRDENEKFTKMPLYSDLETVTGKVAIRIKDSKRLEHEGIRAQFLGVIEIMHNNTTSEFISIGQDLSPPGELKGLENFSFSFKNVEKKYESYYGSSVRLRYIVRITIIRRMVASSVFERELYVFGPGEPEQQPDPKIDEIGLQDILHMDVQYNDRRFPLSGVVTGSMLFRLVKLKIASIELSIKRVELIPISNVEIIEKETVVVPQFVVAEGPIMRGDVVPFRMFLSGHCLSPTLTDVNKRFNVRYRLVFTIVDECMQRYFKPTEILLFRNAEDKKAVKDSEVVAASLDIDASAKQFASADKNQHQTTNNASSNSPQNPLALKGYEIAKNPSPNSALANRNVSEAVASTADTINSIKAKNAQNELQQPIGTALARENHESAINKSPKNESFTFSQPHYQHSYTDSNDTSTESADYDPLAVAAGRSSPHSPYYYGGGTQENT